MNSDDGEDHNFFEVPEGVKSIWFTQFRFVDTSQDDDYTGENISYRDYPAHKIELNGIPEEDTEIGTYRWVNSEMINEGEEDEYEEIYEDTLKSIILTSNGRIYLNYVYIAYEIEYEETKQLDPKYIPLELERGAVEKSLQTPDATALTEDSFAAGTSVAGCRGCYIKAYDFMNKQLFLSKTQVAEPEIAERYIFVSYFKNYEYQVYDDDSGDLLDPIQTYVKIGDISRRFNIYRTNAKHISVVYPNIPEEDEGKNRAILFEDWKRTDSERNQGQTK